MTGQSCNDDIRCSQPDDITVREQTTSANKYWTSLRYRSGKGGSGMNCWLCVAMNDQKSLNLPISRREWQTGFSWFYQILVPSVITNATGGFIWVKCSEWNIVSGHQRWIFGCQGRLADQKLAEKKLWISPPCAEARCVEKKSATNCYIRGAMLCATHVAEVYLLNLTGGPR